MAVQTIASFVDGVIQSQLLEAEQCNEVHKLSSSLDDSRDLARELMRREWLTAFQVNQIFQGQGAGLTLGPYVLLERLGEGGMGQVYKARQKLLNRIVALKVIRKECLDNPRVIARFQREIRAAGQLNHPHIVRAFAADQTNRNYFIAMEYFEGADLARLVKVNGPLPVIQACEYIRQAALGLQHAFERGLVHRDIKPANLLVTKAIASDRRRSSGMIQRPANLDPRRSSQSLARVEPQAYPWGMVKILDMGLARCVDPFTGHFSTQLTQLGSVMGTPEFIAPEQARDSHTCDTRADLYSLGCTLYFLLTGLPPFPLGTMTEKLLQHQFDQPEPVASVRYERLCARKNAALNSDDLSIPNPVISLLDRLLAKRPEDRHQTPIELANELQAILKQLADGAMPPAASVEADTSVMPVLSDSTDNHLAAADAPTEIAPREDKRSGPMRTSPIALILPILLAIATGFTLLLVVGVIAIVLSRRAAMQGGTNAADPFAKPREADEPAWKKVLKHAVHKRVSWEQARDELVKQRTTAGSDEKARQLDEVIAQLPTAFDALDRAHFAPILPPALSDEVIGIYGFAKSPFANKQVASVAVSPNGRWLIASEENNIRIFDTPGAILPTKFTAHDGRIHRLAISPDGRFIVSIGEDGTARVWDAAIRARVATFAGHRRPVTQIAYHPHGTMVATWGKDGHVRLWDPRTGAELRKIEPPQAEVLALAFAPNGTELFWTGAGRDIRWAAINDPKAPIGRFDTQIPGNRVLAFQPLGNLVISGGPQGQLLVMTWDGKALTKKATLKEQAQVHQVVFAPSGSIFATIGGDPAVAVWDAKKLEVQKRFNAIRAPGISAAFSPEGRHLVLGGALNQAFVLRLGIPDLEALAKRCE